MHGYLKREMLKCIYIYIYIYIYTKSKKEVNEQFGKMNQDVTGNVLECFRNAE